MQLIFLQPQLKPEDRLLLCFIIAKLCDRDLGYLIYYKSKKFPKRTDEGIEKGQKSYWATHASGGYSFSEGGGRG